MVRMGVAGSIPAEGSTTNQQLRPGPAPGLFHARRASDRRLPTICQRVTTRSRVITLSGDHLERFAVWSGDAGCALSAPVRYSSSTSMGAIAPWCMALLRRIRVEGRAARWRPSGIRRRVEGWRGPCSWTLVGGACAKRMATVMQVLTAGMDEPGTTAWSSRSGGRRGLPSVDALPRPTVVPESGSAGDRCGLVDRHVVVRLWAFTVSGSPGTDEGPCSPRRGCGTSYGAARRSRGCAGGPAEAWP